MIENNQVRVEDLPSVDDLDFHGLQPSYRSLLIIAVILFWVVLILGSLFLNFMFDDFKNFIYPALGALLILLIINLLLVFFGFAVKKYAIRMRDVVYRSGLIFRSETSIPFNRIQHCEVTQGPFDRLFSLGSVRVYTAGGSGSDLTIPGLTIARAHDLKDFILSKTALDEEE